MGKRGNGEGTITRNAERGRWEGRVTVGTDELGRPIRRKVTGRTRQEVAKRLAELRRAHEAGMSPADRMLTVGAFLEDWVATVLPGTVARTTETQYRDVVRLYIAPNVGRRPLVALTARDVAAMLRQLEDEGRSPNTRRLARSVLRRALRYAEMEGLVPRNVAAIAQGVRIGAQEGRTLTPDQAAALLDAALGHRLGAAFVVALAVGLRRGELLGLAWDDVTLDGDQARLTVRRALKRLPGGLALDEPKTQRSRRTVHLPRFAAEALRRHRAQQAAERLHAGEAWTVRPLGADLVFRTPLGTAVDPDNFRNLCYRLTEGAGIGRWSPHELRHSAASLLLAHDVPLKVVSETLGHSSIRVTADVYGHLLEPARAEAADAMERALGAGR